MFALIGAILVILAAFGVALGTVNLSPRELPRPEPRRPGLT